mmetsp:Transcript_14155/g.42143  ORF Transcript_14155/g.42143 Transcript_14155/m.42143 type:complete len:336 (+) Transcript_14155:328-1335(+)
MLHRLQLDGQLLRLRLNGLCLDRQQRPGEVREDTRAEDLLRADRWRRRRHRVSFAEANLFGKHVLKVRVTRPRARPEACGVVVGSAHQEVAQGVPRQAPDRALVRVLHGRERAAGAQGVPEVHRAAIVARREHRLCLRVPAERGDLLLVAAENLPHAHGPDVHEHHQVVARAAHEVLPVRAPGHLRHRVVVAVNGRDGLARARVPQLDLRILRARGDEALRGVPAAALDVPAVARERALLLARAEVPDLRVRVVRAGDKLQAGWSDGEVADGLLVGLEALEVVDVLVPELDDPELVAADEDSLLVVPLHRLHRGVVRLHDVLVVELEAVPNRHLT